jgi:hypothetical protein
LDEVEIGGFRMDQQTLYCSNVADSKYVQVWWE